MGSARRRRQEGRDRAQRAERYRSSPRPRQLTWICAALVIVTVVVYAPVRHHDFISLDDPEYVAGHPQVSRGLTGRGVAWILTHPHDYNWHPITSLSHMLDVELWGVNAGPHHLVNVAFHVANTLLLFGWLWRVTGATGRSAVVAGLFALHPLHVESVAWVSERKDVLSTLFWLLTLWAYVRYTREPRRGTYAAVIALFAAGLLAKPMLVTLPFVLLLLDYWPLGRMSLGASSATGTARSVSALVREKLPLFALTLVSSVLTFVVQYRTEAVQDLVKFPLPLRLANAIVSYVTYIARTLWPARLAPLYPYPRSVPAASVVASLVVLAAISGAALWAARRRPYLAVGWLWYLGTLVPVVGLVQVGVQPTADRYMYVPMIGLLIAAAWGLHDLGSRWERSGRVALAVAAGVALLACAILASRQVAHWRNNLTLWTHTLAVTRDNPSAHNALGLEFTRLGRTAEAIAEYRRALRLEPNSEKTHNNLAFELARLEKYPEAMTHYAESLRLNPTHAATYVNRALAWATQGKLDEAIRDMREALRLLPQDPNVHYNAALMFEAQRSMTEALRHYSDAIELSPAHVGAHYRLGLLRAQQGSVDAAAEHFRTALRIDPRFQPARRALDQLRTQRGRSGPGSR